MSERGNAQGPDVYGGFSPGSSHANHDKAMEALAASLADAEKERDRLDGFLATALAERDGLRERMLQHVDAAFATQDALRAERDEAQQALQGFVRFVSYMQGFLSDVRAATMEPLAKNPHPLFKRASELADSLDYVDTVARAALASEPDEIKQKGEKSVN